MPANYISIRISDYDNGKLEDFKTISDAVKHPGVPYTTYWVRRLIVEKRVKAIRIGPEGKRGQWLVNMPDLLRYINEIQESKNDKR